MVTLHNAAALLYQTAVTRHGSCSSGAAALTVPELRVELGRTIRDAKELWIAALYVPCSSYGLFS